MESGTPKRVRRSLSEWFEGERVPHPDDPEEHLTYDVLLSLRGWDAEMFRVATPQFTAGARFALYAERLMPVLEEMKGIQNTPMPKGAGFADAARARLAVQKAIPEIRAVLFPGDDDGIA